jgi:hypothetical protein
MSTQPTEPSVEKTKASKKAAKAPKNPRGFSLKEFDKKIDEIAKGISLPFKLDKKFKKTLTEKLLREALAKLSEELIRAELKTAISGL